MKKLHEAVKELRAASMLNKASAGEKTITALVEVLTNQQARIEAIEQELGINWEGKTHG